MYNIYLTQYRTYNFTARIIHLGMWLFALLRFKKPSLCYNHIEIKIGTITWGAIKEGVKDRNFYNYQSSLKNHRVRHIKLQLTEEQVLYGISFLNKMRNRKYEKTMFLSHAWKIFTGRWIGKRDYKYLSCLELAIGFLNATGKYKLDAYLNTREFDDTFIKLKLL